MVGQHVIIRILVCAEELDIIFGHFQRRLLLEVNYH